MVSLILIGTGSSFAAAYLQTCRFLLKYVSRDEIEIAGRGNGGIVEIRNAIAQFEEASPLFGFLRYRRRNVVLKYVPEECSRLVQGKILIAAETRCWANGLFVARVTVHFNAVTERFSPHDTVFPFSTPKELRDTTLSAACSLHTASGSTSSSTSSLRRRRLMEIAEDAEEETRSKRQSTVQEERPGTAKTVASSGGQVFLPGSTTPPALPSGLPESMTCNSLISEVGSYPSQPNEDHLSSMRSVSPTSERRRSSQITRPEMHSYSSYGSNGRPKVKLGPRPSLETAGRPHTAGSATFYRPVSTLPQGLKIFSKGSKKDKDRSSSHHPSDTPLMTISPPDNESMLTPPQDIQVRPHTSGGRPNRNSNASIQPMPSPTTSTRPPPAITPDKARLMKAMELRKKKQMTASQPSEPQLHSLADPIVSPASTADRRSVGPPREVEESLDMLEALAKADDSGIAFDGRSTLRTDESDATRSDSYPVSPIGPSEPTESTRASSISESTDETIQESDNSKQSAGKESPIDRNSTRSNHASREIASNNKLAVTSTFLEPAPESLEQLSPTVYNPYEHSMKSPTKSALEKIELPYSTEQSAEAQENSPAFTPITNPQSISTVSSLAEEAPVSTPVRGEQAIDLASEAEQAPASASKQLQLPQSKFNHQEPAAEESHSKIPMRELVLPNERSSMIASEKSPVGSTFSSDTKRSFTDDGQENGQSKKQKRKAHVEPIRTDLSFNDESAANTDANFSSDDDFMDELSSAVVQEAQPISVSKSPISPVFPSPKKRGGEGRFSRVFSSPLRRDKSGPSTLELPSGHAQPSRAVSAGAAYLSRISQQSNKPSAKKVNVGSGISQRIKALEKLSSSPADTPTGTTGPPPGSSPAFFSVRSDSLRGKSPSIAERANSLTKNSPGVSPESSPETIKIRGRSGSVKSRLDAFRTGATATNMPARSQPESISVTARILRDPSQPYPAQSDIGKDPSEYAPLDFKQSPLVINHQKAISDMARETVQERRQSKERRLSSSSKATTTKERRSSMTIIKDLISDGRSSFSGLRPSNLDPSISSPSIRSPSRPPSTHASPGHHRPMSISSRVSTSSRDAGNAVSPPPTAGSSSSTGTGDEKDKKSNRASRMMRRMSSSLSASRKTLAHAISPTVREESEPIQNIDSQSITSSYPSSGSMNSIDIGDVNVQFPDTLLWKRRSMLLDSQGFLIISPALTGRDKTNAGATRRFHLSEFRMPSVPDADMQELPNSVVLDFVEGGGLQVACEDRAGQGRILNSKLVDTLQRIT